MPPATTFLCTGRRWPNGPPISRMGCLGRGPPRVFSVSLAGFTQRPQLNGIWACFWDKAVAPGPGVSFDWTNEWREVPDWVPFNDFLRVETLLLPEGWTLRIIVGTHGLGMGNNQRSYYEKYFPDGFPTWPDGAYTLDLIPARWPGWVTDRPLTVLTKPLSYLGLPANSCIGG